MFEIAFYLLQLPGTEFVFPLMQKVAAISIMAAPLLEKNHTLLRFV